LERYISPSVFALNKCHLEGDFCWYPGSISTPDKKHKTQNDNIDSKSWLDVLGGHREMKLSTEERQQQKAQTSSSYSSSSTSISSHPPFKICSEHCTNYPVLIDNVFNATDYPLDEWNLAQLFHEFSTPESGEEWLNVHFDKFVTFEDLQKVKQAGMTHVRVPLPHWVLQNHPSAMNFSDLYTSLQQQEPYLAGDRWKYFVRLCGWAKQLGLKVWPNIHTAPNSQNAFDNSGHQGPTKTCQGWMNNDTVIDGYPLPVYQTLQVLDHVTKQMKEDGLDNIVTGFGLLNEPYTDCDISIYKRFMEDGLDIVRKNLGESTSVFVSDAFWAPQFNDGQWWLDPDRYLDTYLDSHYYTVFTNDERHMPPQQHIDHVCHPPKQLGLAIADCCYQDPHHSNSTKPSQGVGRIVTEFSAAFDSMPGELLKIILQGYREHGRAPPNNRTLSNDRKEFLKLYTKAQMIAFEKATSVGWFFWSLKMENDAFLEWDFLKAVELGWFPEMPSVDNPSAVSSRELHGSCDSLKAQAAALNASEIVNVYPWGDAASYHYWDPSGLGWKFDHDQETKKNANATSGDDLGVSKMQNVSSMMSNSSQTRPHHSSIDKFDDDSSPDSSEQITTHVSVWIQVAAITLLAALAYRQIRRGLERRRRRWEYEPIKDQVRTMSSGSFSYGSTGAPDRDVAQAIRV
jgi:glucan 1,3-beta-glucosidase